MSKANIGILFIIFGLAFGSLAIQAVYDRTVGYLIANEWLRQNPKNPGGNPFGGKGNIILYSAIFIIIGMFILWNRTN